MYIKRAVEPYDRLPDDYVEKNQASIKYFKSGHKGILTLNPNDPNNTTYTDDYTKKYRQQCEGKGN